MRLEDIESLLPSHDELWEDPGPALQSKMNFSRATLLHAMELVYMEKLMPPHLGEFSSTLLVNAIYRNTQNISTKGLSQLNSWTPSAEAQQRTGESAESIQLTWLPTDPTVIKWRNSACDCLDVLHWPANSKVARLSGSEHHTILHLHLARLIILTPTEHIQALVSTTISQHKGPSSAEMRSRQSSASHQILDWVVRDRCKARLSIIHCGALYWHVRRHSRDSVLEPYGIYIATLVLWSFCMAMQLPEVVNAVSQGCEGEPEPHFLHLDRPLDDELVQTFVRMGHKMSAHISHVGNILDDGAPRKVLQEGISLYTRGTNAMLSSEHFASPAYAFGASTTSNCIWDIEDSYADTLRDLLSAASPTF
jgi:hypothetical protein